MMTNFGERFNSDQPISMCISELAAWRQEKEGSKLLLPPIQRSIVWSNEQIVNYWDSLLRGYPAGMMIVHRVENPSVGCDQSGTIISAKKGDFQLFDGQQRMAAILLGLGTGQMLGKRKLWVDLGKIPNAGSGLKFQFRMTSTGQPFGYHSDMQNQKTELKKRQDKWKEWHEKQEANSNPKDTFSHVEGKDIIDQTCAVAFADICELLKEVGLEETIAVLDKKNRAEHAIVVEFINALKNAMASTINLQQLRREIVDDPEEYMLFFGRLGQGGTRLSEDELTYSTIKHQYPNIRNSMERIMGGEVGRIAGEVDIVLGTLRVAKTLAQWGRDHKNEWEVISRPSPTFVSKLSKDEARKTVELKFLEMVGAESQESTLEPALIAIRKALAYQDDHPMGLPAILLARLPRELVDVLILFAFKKGVDHTWTKDDADTILCGFVLHWLLFVGNNANAASVAFRHAREDEWSFSQESIRKLIAEFQADGIARFLPNADVLEELRNEVNLGKEGDHMLRSWADRFKAADRKDDCNPGEALRVLSTNDELIKRALMWLQRVYISNKYPNYDPTSDRDEDLPIDRDHIIPDSIFGFHWSNWGSHLNPKDYLPESTDTINFRWGRGVVGNSLGNFRWLDSSENRERQNGRFESIGVYNDLVPNPDDWNKIIPHDDKSRLWSKEDVATFQRLIDLRTLDLFKKILFDSGIFAILPRL